VDGFAFLTPRGALFALLALVPLGSLALVALRARRIRHALGLPAPRRRRLAAPAAALVLVPALLALAAAQPVVSRATTVKQRLGAQAFFVLDTSGSMDASAGVAAPTRIARAKALALRLRDALPGVPIGLASLTDRLLPHLMPTADTRVFDAALAQSIDVNRPPPSTPYGGRATAYDALAAVTKAAFFTPDARRRLLIVFTDGESRPVRYSTLARAFDRPPSIHVLLVHVWRPRERIVVPGGKFDAYYHADPGSGAFLRRLAASVGGTALEESMRGELVADARHALRGGGAKATAIEERRRVALAPWFVLGAAAPLAFLLATRNAALG
jgi:hypothetical protein